MATQSVQIDMSKAPFEINIANLDEPAGPGVALVPGGNYDIAKLLPASIKSAEDVMQRPDITPIFLNSQLCVPRLNAVHEYLWLAGRPMPPRPLTYQIASLRDIIITENIHLHLVWEPGRMFLKPIPRYLLAPTFWETHLGCRCLQPGSQAVIVSASCDKHELYRSAYGFLLSYTALIQYESDHRIARERGLLPECLDWWSWRQMSWELLRHSPRNMVIVNKRYHFGELRLSRLNKIYRARGLSLLSLESSCGKLEDLMRGYKFGFATYSQQLTYYLAPLLGATVYIALVLTAMQVGLATDALAENASFQKASYAFTVFSIIAPLILLAAATTAVLLFVPFNYLVTKLFLRQRRNFYSQYGIIL